MFKRTLLRGTAVVASALLIAVFAAHAHSPYDTVAVTRHYDAGGVLGHGPLRLRAVRRDRRQQQHRAHPVPGHRPGGTAVLTVPAAPYGHEKARHEPGFFATAGAAPVDAYAATVSATVLYSSIWSKFM
ncbi:hypothetical protein FKV24_009245 [Lysobacter maris]|uniref:Uncharacterized protein n=1 Tax=Marilutibacter maris TaxID=1605891 RepID=A0A508ARK2_9GAMM|nr:hypothetical protein [Lysobacter maris]KAB8189498.1 hypothetical protein FKV24_009245 [Lysobacter maris]